MKRALIVSSLLLVAIGCIHIGFSFIEFEEITEDSLWFVSGGLVFIFCGLFNLFIVINRKEELTRIVLLKLANLLLLIFLILLVSQLPMLPGFVGLACSLFLLVFNKKA